MKTPKIKTPNIVAVLLIAVGIIVLAYGGTFTKTTHDADLVPFEMTIKDKETFNIPVWAAFGAILFGGTLLFSRSKT